MEKKRQAGVLLHITALPSDYGIGTMGQAAYDFVDWLADAGMKIWQTLPLLPTNYGDSPYQACANNALNYYFIDLDLLKGEGLLKESDYKAEDWGQDGARVDYGRMFSLKAKVLRKAFSAFDRTDGEWLAFLKKGEYLDFAVFMTIKASQGYVAWTDWSAEYREYSDGVFNSVVNDCREEVEFWQFTQFIFLKQWGALKAYANGKGISIMGDMPIYVSADSVEMWKYRRELFILDDDGNPALQAGVPPDAFTDDGQLWGNPVYNWQLMREKGYLWWKNRIAYAFRLFDIVRIDHFRGFDRFFAVKAGAENAREGEWLSGPSAELFEGMEDLNIVAEDLGVIDQGVLDMMAKTGYPGMRVVEFGFDGNPHNPHKPTNYVENCVAYTGTHDNEPLVGYLQGLDEGALSRFDSDLSEQCEAVGVTCTAETAEEKCLTAIEMLMASKANTCIIPLQDVLCKGSEARMNFPSTFSSSNWTYRFSKKDFSLKTAAWLKGLAEKYER